MESLILYALAVYFLFHVAARSDLLTRPRAWVTRTLPGWLTYPLGCAFCFTWWSTWVLGILGITSLNVVTLCAAPVVNLILDLVVCGLRRANEPPVIASSTTTARGSIWSEPSITLYGDGVQIPESTRYAHLTQVAPFNPLDHEQTR